MQASVYQLLSLHTIGINMIVRGGRKTIPMSMTIHLYPRPCALDLFYGPWTLDPSILDTDSILLKASQDVTISPEFLYLCISPHLIA